MVPDVLAGSKVLERQARMWALEVLPQSIWLDPRVNPSGNWKLYSEACKSMGFLDVEHYLGPQPKQAQGGSQEVKDEWSAFMAGEAVELKPGEDPVEHFTGHTQQKTEKYFELDEEYRQNFDNHYIKTVVQFQNFLIKMQQEKMSDYLAAGIIRDKQRGIESTGDPNV
jgi:hypothetical protein